MVCYGFKSYSLILPVGKDFLFVFGGKSESEAVLGDGYFLCPDQQQWAEVSIHVLSSQRGF